MNHRFYIKVTLFSLAVLLLLGVGRYTASRYEYFVMDGYVMRYDAVTGDACAITDAIDPHQKPATAGKILCGKP